MTIERRTLPSRRNSNAVRFEMNDGYSVQTYTVQYTEFAPGDLAEIFITTHGVAGKVGMPLSNVAKDLSVLFSIARQYGAPTDVIMAALSQEAKGVMLGPLGEFLRLHKAGQAYPDPDEPPTAPETPGNGPSAPDTPTAGAPVAPDGPSPRTTGGAYAAVLDRRAEAKARGYTGDVCQDCGNMTMARNGTCLVCATCGRTSGCS